MEKSIQYLPSPQTKINYVQTVQSNFCTTPSTTQYVPINNDIKVQQPYFHDDNEKGSYEYYATE